MLSLHTTTGVTVNEGLECLESDMEELLELGWFERSQIRTLPRRTWIDRVIAGSSRLIPGGGRINLTLRRAAAA